MLKYVHAANPCSAATAPAKAPGSPSATSAYASAQVTPNSTYTAIAPSILRRVTGPRRTTSVSITVQSRTNVASVAAPRHASSSAAGHNQLIHRSRSVTSVTAETKSGAHRLSTTAVAPDTSITEKTASVRRLPNVPRGPSGGRTKTTTTSDARKIDRPRSSAQRSPTVGRTDFPAWSPSLARTSAGPTARRQRGAVARPALVGQSVYEVHESDQWLRGRHRAEPLLEDRRHVAGAVQLGERAVHRQPERGVASTEHEAVGLVRE